MTDEALQAGNALPEVEVTASARDLVLFAAGSGDFNEIHFNRDAALAQELPDIIVHGRLKAAHLTKYAVRCAAGCGRLRTFEVRYRGIDRVGAAMRFGDSVRERSPNLVLDMWIKNDDGAVTTTAVAEFDFDDRRITQRADGRERNDANTPQEYPRG